MLLFTNPHTLMSKKPVKGSVHSTEAGIAEMLMYSGAVIGSVIILYYVFTK